jgi:hypothetical protein
MATGVTHAELSEPPGSAASHAPGIVRHKAEPARGPHVATREREGPGARDPRTGRPSFVTSSVACLGTDFGREVRAVLAPPE